MVPVNNNGVYLCLSKLLQANKCDVRGQPQLTIVWSISVGRSANQNSGNTLVNASINNICKMLIRDRYFGVHEPLESSNLCYRMQKLT